MVKRDLSLTDIIKKGAPYLDDVNIGEIKAKVLNMISQYGLDAVYEEMKGTPEWEEWSKLSDMPRYYLEEIPTKKRKVSTVPKVRLMNWADGLNERCSVIKFEVFVRR